MKYRLRITVICAAIIHISLLVFAQNVEVTDSCSGRWQSISAVPDSNAVIMLSTTKEGSEQLHWLSPNEKIGKLEIHKAKGQVNTSGKIEICTAGQIIIILNNEISLQDLKKNHNLQPGYYAIRVSIPDNFNNWNNSKWITIKLK
jgi:hypothetical protein